MNNRGQGNIKTPAFASFKFVVTEKGHPIHFVEAKLSDASITKGLSYLKSKSPDTRASLAHLKGKKYFINSEGIEHIPAHKLLAEM